MRNLVFMFWVLLWPLICSLIYLLDSRTTHAVLSLETCSLRSLFEIVVWIIVGILLYQKPTE